MVKTHKTLKFANKYGNVEVKNLPKGYRHLKGSSLASLCRKLKIAHAPAVVGFKGNKKYGFKPKTDGVVVHKASVGKLVELMTPQAIALNLADLDDGAPLSGKVLLHPALLNLGRRVLTGEFDAVYANAVSDDWLIEQ